jgi:hypothetical protein
MEERSFFGCSSLSEVNFERPSKLLTIQALVFGECSSLESLNIVGSVTIIHSTFIRESGVCQITVDDDNRHFRTVDEFLVNHDGLSVVSYFGSAPQVVISASVVVLKAASFHGRDSLAAVNFEAGSQLRVIESEGFCYCESLRSIRLPGLLESIGAEAFYGCSSLAEVTFEEPSSLCAIGEGAFGLCASLTSITFPSSVTLIAKGAFTGCGKLRSVTFEARSPPRDLHPDAFADCPNLDKSFLPKSGCNVS